MRKSKFVGVSSDYIKTTMYSSLVREPFVYPKGYAKSFHVSDTGKCMRMRWLKRWGVTAKRAEQKPEDLWTNWLAQVGNLIHDHVYTVLQKNGLLIQCEDSVKSEHFKGRYDALIKKEGELIMVDVKSVNPWKLHFMSKGEDDLFHLKQVLTYVMMLRDEGKDITKGLILYANREPNKKTSQIVFLEREYLLLKPIEKLLREEQKALVDFWDRQVVPSPTPQPAWMKNYNDYEPFNYMTTEQITDVLKLSEATDRTIYTNNKEVWLEGDDGKKTIVITI